MGIIVDLDGEFKTAYIYLSGFELINNLIYHADYISS